MAHDVDKYLQQFDGEIKNRLLSMQAIVHENVPDAVESISYGIIAYKLHGTPLVYFGAYPNHIGLYATPNGHAAFAQQFEPYEQGKGSVKFPHTQPLPIRLIKEVVRYRKMQCYKKGGK